jgi:hypothetical protein
MTGWAHEYIGYTAAVYAGAGTYVTTAFTVTYKVTHDGSALSHTTTEDVPGSSAFIQSVSPPVPAVTA